VTTYVALLRGINVGGHKRIAMARLRALLADLGYTDVRTHLQSGNAIFDSTTRSSDKVASAIEGRIAGELDLEVIVIVRTGDEMAAVVNGNTLVTSAIDPTKMLVAFLSAKPDPTRLRDIDPTGYEPEMFEVAAREIYMWCPNGQIASEIVGVFSEKRLGVDVTVRNWRTVTKLAELAGASSG